MIFYHVTSYSMWASEAANGHPHREICALYEAGRDVRWIGIASYDFPFRFDALALTVARFRVARIAVQFYQHRIVAIHAKRSLDGLNVCVVTIRSDLHSTCDPRRHILHKSLFPRHSAMPHHVGHYQLSVRIQRRPSPNVAPGIGASWGGSPSRAFPIFLQALLFLCPDFCREGLRSRQKYLAIWIIVLTAGPAASNSKPYG